jgi:hypothetical protein
MALFISEAMNRTLAAGDLVEAKVFSTEEAQMFDALHVRMKAVAAAGIIIIATIIGAGVSAAETPKAKVTDKVTEVSLQNALKISVAVTFSGTEALQKKGSVSSVGDKAQVIGNVPDGTTIKWEAKPKTDQDKNMFTACKGEKKVSGLKDTIVMSSDSCTKANAAAKTGTSDTQANNKTPAKSADNDAGSIQITFENTTDNQTVSLKITDQATPGVTQEISSIASATNNGTPWPSAVKNTATATVKKDKSGKYNIEVNWNCRDNDGRGKYSHGGDAKYNDSASTMQIVKSSDGCALKTAK